MKVFSHHLTSALDLIPESSLPNNKADLVLVHGNPFSLEVPGLIEKFNIAFPNACIAGCSSAGELLDGHTYENSIVYSAIQFDNTVVKQSRIDLPHSNKNEYQAGSNLATELQADDLVMVLLLSEGLAVDCDELISGMREILGAEAPIFGGLAGDSLAFEHTVVLDNDGVYSNSVVAVGLYGNTLKFNTSSSLFNQKGTEIEITGSDSNIVTHINGESAGEFYEKMMKSKYEIKIGNSSSLNFPLIILDPVTKEPLYCRTIHEYDLEDNILIAAGSVPIGPAKLLDLTDNEDFLKDAKEVSTRLASTQADFSIVISCAGRRGAMGSAWIEEYPLIQETLGNIPSIGFYSYGEIGTSHYDRSTIVHNQTINIATLHEA